MRTNIGTSLDDQIIELHSQGNGMQLIARILSERTGLRITRDHTQYAFKRLNLKPHIGSSNGGNAKWSNKSPGQKLADEYNRLTRAEQIKAYRGFRDLPLFSVGNVFKMRYRNDPEFRRYQIERAAKRKKTHPHENRASAKRWAKTDKGRSSVKQWNKKPENRVVKNLRKRLQDIIGGRKGYSKTAIIKGVGCTRTELITHLESQFIEGMTWENYGEWHIDHIIPLASAKVDCFDQTVANLSRLNHYTNLQPLWAAENIAKGASMPTPHPPVTGPSWPGMGG